MIAPARGYTRNHTHQNAYTAEAVTARESMRVMIVYTLKEQDKLVCIGERMNRITGIASNRRVADE